MDKPKIVLFDIECFHMNWDASVAVIYCMSWKFLGEKEVHTESVWDYPGKDALDDGPVMKRIYNILNDADMLVSYNGIRFDIPFIQTRLLANGLGTLPPVAHKDVYYTAKFKLKLKSNALFAVQNFLNLSVKKTPVDLREWLKALVGDKKSQAKIIEHCEHDVLVLEKCYNRLLPLMGTHPRLHGYGPCNKCGSVKIQSRGTFYTAGKTQKRKFYCTSCGGWETRLEPAAKKNAKPIR